MSEKRQLELVATPPAEARPATAPVVPPPRAPGGPDAESPAAPRDFGALVQRLLGRAPSGPELVEFVRVRDALGLRDNDALWLVLLALHHQRREIERAIDVRLADARETADAILETARARFLEQFPAALKQAARKVTLKALGFDGPVVLSGPVAGVTLALAGLGAVGAVGLAYALGERAGHERGMLAARAEVVPKPPAPPARGR